MKLKDTVALLVLVAVPGAFIVADDNTPMLSLVEAVCIDYAASGDMQQGTYTRCHRDYAYEQYEIQDITMSFGGFSQSTNQHSITIGPTIYVIDLSTNTGTKMTNPMYDQMVNAMQNSGPGDTADAFIAAMGYTPTGATKTIADTSCDVYSAPMLGTVCLTDEGLMLEQSIMGNLMVATNVSIGDGGPEENYTLYQDVPITAGPDLSNMPGLQDLMNQGQQQ
ncbi:MAG: hypothetical protein KJP08_09550 [Gammaproteobacteria bacterium]|nr:hypothetical protein [Gammaproteobacteria bacterium]NNF50289.1 hypothetical protein [Woeseiaceae bacterium]MBT8095043.1 hypothetical protein [Gammaproteobacteria bacterium]MBT8105588.1 hypothetical protein [Gammaproteobacteria bacterium]NNK25602.1 hypothetical protein [Woeseiaceae bacterium]